MRILFVIPTLSMGGAERVATILLNHFSQENEVGVFLMEHSHVERYPLSDDVRIIEANINVRRGNKFSAIVCYIASFAKQRNTLKKEIIRFQPDAVFSFLPKADVLTYSIRKVGHFVWIPSERNDPMARSNIERKVLNFIYRSANILVCQTKKVAEYYESHGVKKAKVIWNPLILKESSDVKVDIPKSYFIAVGRLDKQKNFEMLINAFAKAVIGCNCSDKLLILGDGPEREKLDEQIKALGMEDTVVLVGRTTNVNAYLKKAKAFIMSSNYEGMPNAMLEAMAMGLPIISTDFFTGAAREFIDDENGIIVPVNDEQEMTKAIQCISEMDALTLCAMGKVSRQKVQLLGVETICNDWTQIVQKEIKI